MKTYLIEESPFSHFFTADTRSAWLWLILRVYLGYLWFEAGWEKFNNPAWVGSNAGQALTGFVNGALTKTAGAHPDVQGWYASFLETAVLPHVATWSYLVTFGEMLVGIALIVGFLVGISALFGVFMNLNFMLAGAVSVNPIWATLGIGLILAWKVAGYWGADRYVLPLLHRSIRPRVSS
ncbi:MAG: DoxX family membrane protein [Candidatus Paceibacterota bacterium]